jgi:hypothetical protein
MKRRAHAWVALRALKLVEDSKQAAKLVELLSYYVSDVWEGAWLPDTLIVDMQYGHIFKMDDNSQRLGLDITQEQLMAEEWMKVPYEQLRKKLSGNSLCLEYVKDCPVLMEPYRAHPTYGGHLPNRVIAISQTIADMLKMSDYPLIFYARQKTPKAFASDLMRQKVKDLSVSPIFSPRQIALMLFILAHYITDAHMPLHCDLRDCDRSSLRQLPGKLHESIEELWELSFPEKSNLLLHEYLMESIDHVVSSLPDDSIIRIDKDDKYKLSPTIPRTVGDEWREMVYIARTSYAVSRKLIDAPFKDADELVAAKGEEFKDVTNCIFHDAVESVARLWFKAWERFTGRSHSSADTS